MCSNPVGDWILPGFSFAFAKIIHITCKIVFNTKFQTFPFLHGGRSMLYFEKGILGMFHSTRSSSSTFYLIPSPIEIEHV